MKTSGLTRTLDENLTRAIPAKSVFVSEETTRNDGTEEERLECFNPRYAGAAEALSAETKTKSLGEGRAKERKLLGDTELHWRNGCWNLKKPGCQVEIGPECDEADCSAWLRSFGPIQKNVLRRQTTKRETIRFVIGEKANRRQPKPCVAYAEDNTVGFPTTANGSHILAVKLCEASEKTPGLKPVRLEKITLHEVGHTLKRFFEFGREEILAEMMRGGSKNWHRAANLLREVSPHYLGEQSEEIEKKLQANESMAGLAPGRETEKIRNKFAYDIGREIFAEIVRHFYLEPALEGKPKTFAKTGFYALDDLCSTLQEETVQTLLPKPKPIQRQGLELD